MRRKKDGTLGFITKRRLNNEREHLDYLIKCAKEDKDHGKITRLRANYHAIPGAIEEANDGRRRINNQDLHRLDGQCGNALARRGLDTKIGAERVCVDFWVTGTSVEPVLAWYAPRWFTEMIYKLGDRKPFYRQMDKIAKEGPGAIDEAIGLLILGEL